MLVGAIVLISVLVIVSTLVLLWPYIMKLRSKKDFFNRAYRTTYSLARDKDYYIINDVELVIENKKIHFDHILFGEKYIYCIGNNYRDGNISGKYSDNQWFLYKANGKTEYIKNPLLLHSTRIEYLKSALKADDILLGICVMNDECLIDKIEDCPDNIVLLNQKELKDFIIAKEKRDISPIDSIQLEHLVRFIYNMSQCGKEKK